MYVLGVSCFYHDGAACLLQDGRIVAAAEEERFSRLKHDSRFPVQAIEYCLAEAGITPEQVDAVAFYEKPLLKFERILSQYVATFPGSREAFVRAMGVWLSEKIWARGLIRQGMRFKGRIAFGEHHLSHAASAFHPSPFSEAAVLTADGVGEWTTTSVGLGHGHDLELIREIRFPHSLGLLYSAFTAYLGFEVNEGEYKVMGMSAYGRPRFVDQVRRLIDVADDGSYQLDMRYFDHHRALHTYSQAFTELFGPARAPDAAELDQRYADLAASVQHVVEETLVTLATDLRRVTGMPDLCMAGGVALNGLANTRILKEAGFRSVWIQPAAGDSGGAIGAATYLYHTGLGHPRTEAMTHAYLGPSYTEEDIRTFLSRHDLNARRPTTSELLDEIASALSRGEVIGWFQGRMEFGPRALGSRSILADPRTAAMKDILNEKIKHRESFRPFAPAITAEDRERYFDLPCESPYMLFIAPVVPGKRGDIPAVTHEDGTARLQTVARQTNPLFHALIRAFGDKTGVPVIVNTSFNVRGEPIVRTPEEAYNDFAHTDIDRLVLGPFVLTADTKRRFMPYPGRRRTRDTADLAM